MSVGDRVRAALQYPLPQHLLSRLAGPVVRCRQRTFKNALIRWFVRRYRVELAEAEHTDPTAYPHFDAFFTRALAPGTRPGPSATEALASPVDGTVSELGRIESGRIYQAKGRHYTAAELVGDETEAATYDGGHFITLYLSPRDYHRIHAPAAGRLVSSHYLPGRLFSVNPATTRAVPRLFARNERLATRLDTAAGPVGLVMVGALMVAGIETTWSGWVTPPHQRRPRRRDHDGPAFGRGDEMGRFHMGSTVILLLPPRAGTDWSPGLTPGTPVRLGQPLATLATGVDQYHSG
ncbi:MAG: archaetidylserine decarboxylase [Pseudomonadota bacterium]